MAGVVVTGAGSGIGRATVIRLREQGFTVFAGVRREVDLATWPGSGPGRVIPVRLDVAEPATIAAAAATARGELGDAGLLGLVNNAGIAVAAPLEYLPPDELRRQFEVNVVGQLAVIQAFLPLLRPARGRVVNLGSVSGRLAMPFLGPYAASKFALRAISDALRVELRPSGVSVSLIEAGTIATPLWESGAAAARALAATFPPEAAQRYGPALERLAGRAAGFSRTGIPVEQVAEVVLRALTSPRPRAYYAVSGRSRRWSTRLLEVLPGELRDRLVLRTLR
ncbi:MAG TPA: SDR family oxidoreductase [Thermomicrobiaceae bacterium]|nr:SDR family oxidoreductase [Thermomicrobiaceae bacterium]